MELRTGRSSQPQGPALLRAMPGVDADELIDAPEGISGVEDGVREDVALLRDAATLVTARRRLDGLLQLAADPFDPVAYRGLSSYLVGPDVLALAACERVRASTVRDA